MQAEIWMHTWQPHIYSSTRGIFDGESHRLEHDDDRDRRYRAALCPEYPTSYLFLLPSSATLFLKRTSLVAKGIWA